MIPYGCDPIDLAGVAALFGITKGTLINQGIHRQPGFPAPLNRGQRYAIWDRAQVVAHRDGRPVPALPSMDHPDDLLDSAEAPAYAGIRPGTWSAYLSQGRIEATEVVVFGARHWVRGTIRRRHTTPPGKRGRPHDTRDAVPRGPRRSS